jgi:hypothetical protein
MRVRIELSQAQVRPDLKIKPSLAGIQHHMERETSIL